jgi:subtilisin family serine protease
MSAPRLILALSLRLTGLAVVGGFLAGTPFAQSRQAAPRLDRAIGVIPTGIVKKGLSRHAPRVPKYAPNVVVVTYKTGESLPMRRQIESRYGLTVDAKTPSRYFVRYFIGAGAKGASVSVEAAARALAKERGVRSAEPDYAIYPDQVPSDPSFSYQWGLRNTGQSGGAVDEDIDAPEAWAMLPAGPDVLVAVLDDGVQTDHPDLAANIWTNPGEIAGNGIDDDGNGYVDDIRGWDTADNDNNPMPATAADSHGTHVAGTVAAVTNNGIGVAGTGKRIKVVPVRMYKGQATWMTSLASGVDYARVAGAKVINVSYNTDDYTTFLMDSILRAQAADIIYVGSSGNNYANVDKLRGQMKKVASNIMFVAASDRYGNLAAFSNYGQTTDIAAPGQDILSTLPNSQYGLASGTSMATPHVAAAAGVVRAMHPGLNYAQVIIRLNYSAEYRSQFFDKIAGGRLNLAAALETDSIAPAAPGMPELLAKTSSRLRLRFAGTGDDGTAGNASRHEIRMSNAPITAANYANARVGSLSPKGLSGQPMTVELEGLTPGAPYYLAIRAYDNVGNPSAITPAGPFFTRDVAWKDTVEGAAKWTAAPGTTWAMTTGSALSGQKAWEDSPGTNYAPNTVSALTLNDAVTVTGPTALRFSARFDMEMYNDYMYVEASTDGGATWMVLNWYTETSLDWRSYNVMLPGTGMRAFKFRFRFFTDADDERDGIALDDFSVVPMSTLFFDNNEGDTTLWSPGIPWGRTTTRSLSPTNSWSDSPNGSYSNNQNARLLTQSRVDVTGVAEPMIAFAIWYDLEYGYDYLDYYAEYGGTQTIVSWFSGQSNGWMYHTQPVLPSTAFRPIFSMWTDESDTADGVNLDDIGIYGEPWQLPEAANLSLSLDGFAGSSRTFTLEVYNGATLLESHALTLPVNGQTVMVPTFAAGSASFVVRADGWLRKLQNVTITPGMNLSLSLVNGDVDRDNVITSTDFVITNNCFGKSVGQTGYDARADLTGDGKVDVADLAIITRNQRKRGD